ncbi:MAG: hypothetical protein R2813_11820 [Flavobacteriales bacterium]
MSKRFFLEALINNNADKKMSGLWRTKVQSRTGRKSAMERVGRTCAPSTAVIKNTQIENEP